MLSVVYVCQSVHGSPHVIGPTLSALKTLHPPPPLPHEHLVSTGPVQTCSLEDRPPISKQEVGLRLKDLLVELVCRI